MLTAEHVEAAFVAAALEQDGGPFNWRRVAELLNARIADDRYQRRAAFMLSSAPVGVDGRATKTHQQ